jgi:hypothetical protein
MSERPWGLPGRAPLHAGEDRGKTTSACGVALRAVARGWEVSMVRFTTTGELPPGGPIGEIAGAGWLEPESDVASTGIALVNIPGGPHVRGASRGGREGAGAGERGDRLGPVPARNPGRDPLGRRPRPGGPGTGAGAHPGQAACHQPLLTGHDANQRFLDGLRPVVDPATEMVKPKRPSDEGHRARKGRND